MKNLLRLSSLCLCAAFFVGCSTGAALQDGAAKTTVTVTLDGAPVEGASVVFMPESGGRSATGRTDEQGQAEMGTSNTGDGVFPGQYKVVVVKTEDDPSTVTEDPEAYRQRGQAPPSAKQIYLVPKKYSSASTSGLNATIQSDTENDVTLELTSA